MTLWRQDWNGAVEIGCRMAGGIVLFCLLADPAFAQATTERVVVNRVSGYAISGFDPVAYFADGKASAGQDGFEAVHDGALWRFRNQGNLNAFRQHPEIYAPLFGGYDPVAVAGGRPVAGRPEIWAVVGARLMLFSSQENRAALLAGPHAWLQQASRRWPGLRAQLSP